MSITALNKKQVIIHGVVLVVVSYLFLMFGNGILPLTNPDEVFYTQTAKEMMIERTWTVPYLFSQPNFEKPVLTYILLRAGYELFGVTSFSSRLFPALFGILGVLAVYFLALLGHKNEKKAFICALILSSAGLYIGLSRTVFTDMIFSVLILLAFLAFFYSYQDRRLKGFGIMFSFVSMGLAVLAKGPLGFLIPFAAILLFLGARKDFKFLSSGYFVSGFFILLAISLPWYWFMIKKFNGAFIHEFFYNDHIRRLFEAEHKANDTWFFYPFTMIGCMFPWSIFVLASLFGFFTRIREALKEPFNLFLLCWIAVVFMAFQFAHSKLTSYIFPLFPALAIFAGGYLYDNLNFNKKSFIFILRAWWVMLLIMPVALIVASFHFSLYVPFRVPVYIFCFLYVGILALMAVAIKRRNLFSYVYLMAPQVPVLLFFALNMHAQYDAHVSSQNACRYLEAHHQVTTKILCSKSVVRGVRFFTDKEVAVINVGGGDFFSPHPIPYFNSDEKVLQFLNEQAVTYGVLTRSSFSDIERISGNNKFRVSVLEKIGNTFVVIIERS